ncbi:MAG: hypothetical protein NTV16_03755 [Actinobacteria bacterium]|nr:hypothetical protein [Actinomycetota bacterium]
MAIRYNARRPSLPVPRLKPERLLKKLLMVVTDPNVELWFEDEAHIGRNTTVTRMWAPRDEQPKLLSAATRQKVGMLGVVNPALGELF